MVSRRALIDIPFAERYTKLSHIIVQGPSFGKKCRLRAFIEPHFRGSKPLQIFTKLRPIIVYILTTNLAAVVCACAKFDQFRPLRSHFGSKPPENFVRIAKFPYAAFGPLLAFHCPLFVTKNNNSGWNRHASSHIGTGAPFTGRRYCLRADNRRSASKALDLPKIHRYIVNSSSYSDPWFSSTMLDSDRSDLRSNSRQVVQFLLTLLLFANNKAYF